MPGKKLALAVFYALSDVAQLIGQHTDHLLGKDWQIFASNSEKLHQLIDIPDPSDGNDTKLSQMSPDCDDQAHTLPDA
jgi:hypothetical protein